MSRPSSLYALDPATGALYWAKQLPEANYGTPAVDQGNLYLVLNVFATPEQAYSYTAPLKRTLLAIQGSDGRTLWQQDIPWNRGQLSYAMIEAPAVSAGAGRVYLVDWTRATYNPVDEQATMGAFSARNGALVWTSSIT